MKQRKLAIVVLILIVSIAAALYAIKRNREKNVRKFIEEHAIQSNAKNLSEIISPDMIDEMLIYNPSGQFRLRKDQNGEWMLIEPIQTRANQDDIVILPEILADMKVASRVEKTPKTLPIYGLDNPDIKVKYKVKGSQNWREIDFGRRSPIAGNYYAMDPARGEVILVPYAISASLSGTPMSKNS